MNIKVLWIDDQPNDRFIDYAYNCGIDIEAKQNVDDGILELKSSQCYDAIILDANCISHNNGSNEPDIDALGYALRKITENGIKLPWFVFSGGGFRGEEHIDYAVKPYERPYDNVLWYKKPAQTKELFDKIKEVVGSSDVFKYKSQYPEEFEAAKLIPDAERLLIEGFSFEYCHSQQSVQDYFNPARKIFERIVSDLKQRNILPKISLNAVARLLKSNTEFVEGFRLKEPIMEKPLAHSLKFFLDMTQDGSHDDCDLQLGVDKYVRSRQNINLFRSVFYILLDLLLWYSDKITENKINNIESNFIHKGTVYKTINTKGQTVFYSGKYELKTTSDLTEGCIVGVMQSMSSKNPFGSITEFVHPKYYVILES